MHELLDASDELSTVGTLSSNDSDIIDCSVIEIKSENKVNYKSTPKTVSGFFIKREVQVKSQNNHSPINIAVSGSIR